MNKVNLDTSKIAIYAQIQKALCELECNSEDEAINILIKNIPQSFLHQKEDLMVICQLFAYYARICETSKKRNSIKLFELILNQMKIHLQDESSFLWTIFGSLFYFKLWMYNEGLISIEQIILAAQEDQSSMVIEYFLPEIIKEKPELFEKELKFKYSKTFSEESIQQFKEIRKKHFKWLRDSADYNDQLYTEIEKNRLRLSIKRDDIDLFQKVLSESNISVNSKIIESSLENFLRFPTAISLLEYAIEFNSIQIIKFLIMNDANFNVDMIYFAIQRNNYDIIHLLESNFKEKFGIESLPDSVTLWNNEMTEYALNNYDFNFLFEKNINPKSDAALRPVIQAFISLNFIFIESTILSFLENNPEFLEHNIYEIILSTFSEKSCFFLKAFIQFPGIDVNHHFTNYNITLIYKALDESNVKGLEILLNHPDIDVNCPAYQRFSPLQIACKIFSDMKIVKMLCNHPKIDVDKTDSIIQTNAFQLAVCCGHFFAAQYFIDRYPNLEEKNFFYLLFFLCLCYNHLYSLKMIIKYFMEKSKNLTGEQLIDNFKKFFSSQSDYKNEFEDEMRLILLELNKNL